MRFILFSGSNINLFHVSEVGVKLYSSHDDKLLPWQKDTTRIRRPHCWVRLGDFVYREYFDTITQAEARKDEIIRLANE